DRVGQQRRNVLEQHARLGEVGDVADERFQVHRDAPRTAGVRRTRYGFPSSEATMPLTIRPPTPADVPVMVEYNRRLARETEAKQLDPAVLRAGVLAALADPDRKGPYFLACDGDDVVGQMQVTFEWSDWRNGWFWWVQGVYVRADARGRGVFRM